VRIHQFRMGVPGLFGISALVAACLSGAATAQEHIELLPPIQASPGPLESVPNAAAQSAANRASSQAGSRDNARYRKFNNKWWYWLPNNQWALWDGKQWTIPSPKAHEYQEWRQQQFAGRYSDSGSQDDAMRRRAVERWRNSSASQGALTKNDGDYQRQIDRFHDKLMITPYDYRIGTAGHGLFDCDPDRVIANTGRFNYATSGGGYMGGALRSPYGY